MLVLQVSVLDKFVHLVLRTISSNLCVLQLADHHRVSLGWRTPVVL
jgi:hypothetical protein